MNKKILTHLGALVLASGLQTAQAAILTIDLPGDNLPFTTTQGATFDANIFIADVNDFAGFEFNITFNSTKLQALSLTSGSIFGADDTYSLPSSINPDFVHFGEAISGESLLPSGINIAANAPTLLGTIRFKALSTGERSLIDITSPVLSDFIGDSIGGSKQGAFVTINAAPPAAVPVPAAFWLMASGILGFIGIRRKTA